MYDSAALYCGDMMATSTELVDKVAAILAVPAPTVALHLRNLREAGHISLSGRGRHAAKMTPADAANLLVATVGSRNVKDSANIVERPGGLLAGTGRWRLPFVRIPELQELAPDHCFLDAVKALVVAAANGSLQIAAEELEGGNVDLASDTFPALNIEVKILGPTPRGAILVEETVTDEEGRRYRYRDHYESHFYSQRRAAPGGGNLAWLDVATPDEMDSDLRTEFTFTHRTLAVVGELLASHLTSESIA
jgi:hypothetical protein